jgi:hypothetical protein
LRSIEVRSPVGQSKGCMERPSLHMPIELAATHL